MSLVEPGAIVTGEVVAVKSFGAFVKLDTGETGLVHISQLSTGYTSQVEDILKIGDKVTAKVLKRDQEGKISLSIKALKQEENTTIKAAGAARSNTKSTNFEQLMKKWQQSSEERLSTLAAKQKKGK
ncbi:MAG: hypothetical protein RLZ12_146 [Bacillota bacterium]|jgi:predicted RNA-binding protein with RPS1 domain